jgi:hypothetical protein
MIWGLCDGGGMAMLDSIDLMIKLDKLLSFEQKTVFLLVSIAMAVVSFVLAFHSGGENGGNEE